MNPGHPMTIFVRERQSMARLGTLFKSEILNILHSCKERMVVRFRLQLNCHAWIAFAFGIRLDSRSPSRPH